MEVGSPSIPDYFCFLKSETYNQVYEFAHRFYKEHSDILQPYISRWLNPLSNWSRRWEYGFALTYLRKYARRGSRVLDAGSGISFFPYMLSSLGYDVHACDVDASLEGMYAGINSRLDYTVNFQIQSIDALSYEDESFSAIYCISVLEHMKHKFRKKAIDEFHRVLRKDGVLVITFDVSLDGSANVSIEESKELLRILNSKFEPLKALDETYISDLRKRKDILTTKFIACYDRKLLPWKYPLLSALIKPILQGKLPRSTLKNVAIFCGVYFKR